MRGGISGFEIAWVQPVVATPAFDYSKNKAALVVLSQYATPESLRRIGVARLAGWLTAPGCRNSDGVAKAAVGAAHTQTTTLPAQAVGSALVIKLAASITAIDVNRPDFRSVLEVWMGHDEQEVFAGDA